MINRNIILMTIWQPTLDGRFGPKFRQISDAIGEAARNGDLRPGERLPPQRDLAYLLGVSLNTVSRAYADAIDRGFLKGEVGRGTYVRGSGPLPFAGQAAGLKREAAGPIDFSLNLPAPGNADRELARTLKDLSETDGLAAFLDYDMFSTSDRHAAAAASWLGRTGLDARPEGIVFTSGAQHGLLVALMATVRPGDVLFTDELTYAPIRALAHRLDLKLRPVASEGGTMSSDALEAACRGVAGKAVYCMPTLHTPTTATMNVERRAALAEVAGRHDLTLIEDDVFGFLPIDRPPPLANFAPERTIYIGSASKSLAPGLRVGFLHAPTGRIADLRAAVNLTSWMSPPLMTEIACRWIEDGTAERLNEFQRSEAMARQAMARELLPEACLHADLCGFHVWLTLPPEWHADVFRMEAERRGVKVMVGGAFAIRPGEAPNALRLCLSHERDRQRVRQGLEIVADLLGDRSETGALIL